MKMVSIHELREDLNRYLRLAQDEEIVITDDGKPIGVLEGFATEDDWFDFQLENDPRFEKRITQARRSLRTGNGIRLEDFHS